MSVSLFDLIKPRHFWIFKKTFKLNNSITLSNKKSILGKSKALIHLPLVFRMAKYENCQLFLIDRCFLRLLYIRFLRAGTVRIARKLSVISTDLLWSYCCSSPTVWTKYDFWLISNLIRRQSELLRISV